MPARLSPAAAWHRRIAESQRRRHAQRNPSLRAPRSALPVAGLPGSSRRQRSRRLALEARKSRSKQVCKYLVKIKPPQKSAGVVPCFHLPGIHLVTPPPPGAAIRFDGSAPGLRVSKHKILQSLTEARQKAWEPPSGQGIDTEGSGRLGEPRGFGSSHIQTRIVHFTVSSSSNEVAQPP